MMNRSQLIDQYQRFKAEHDRAPNLYSVPNVLQMAGFCLQFPAPLHALSGCAPQDLSGAYWAHVRSTIVAALGREGGAR